MFWRCYNWIYTKVFNHSSKAMGVYMDFMRPLALGPEARNYYGVNMDMKISQYRKHNLYVKQHCPPDRLLLYKLGDGWEPLCKFLNKVLVDLLYQNYSSSLLLVGKDCEYLVFKNQNQASS